VRLHRSVSATFLRAHLHIVVGTYNTYIGNLDLLLLCRTTTNGLYEVVVHVHRP
jgi:hypothetical protein